MGSRLARAVALVVLGLIAAVLAPLAFLAPAHAAACNPDATLCVDYSLSVTDAETGTPTTTTQRPVDVDLAFANVSPNHTTNTATWLNRVSATLLSSGTVRPMITGSAALPDGLLVAGSAVGCTPGGDASFSGCTAGHGVAYVKLSGFLYNGVYKATFGVQRIYNDRANLGSHFAALTADISICADLNGGAMSCDQQVDESETLTLDLPAAGQPLTLDVTLPTPVVPFHTVQNLGADSATLHLDGRSDQLVSGPADKAYDVVRLPMRCGQVSGSATAYAGAKSVTVNQPFEVTGCAQLDVTQSRTSLTHGQSVTIAGTLTDYDLQAPIANRTIALRACTLTAATSCSSTPVATTTTSGTGAFAFAVTPAKHTRYFVQHAAYGDRPATYVDKVVKVAPTVSIKASSLRVVHGGKVKLTGKVAPNHAGRVVKIQRYAGGTWRTLAKPTLSSTSRYAKAVTLQGSRGQRVKLRVVVPAHGDHLTGRSAVVTIRLT